MKKRILLAAASVALCLCACGAKNNQEQEAYRQYGITCMENGDYEEAVKAFQDALDQSLGKVGETELDICFYKAQAQLLGGDADAAMETYNAVIQYNGNARAYYLRGSLYFAQGEQELAVADYEQALREEPGDYELYLDIYQSMSSYDMAEEGQKYLNQAMEIKGNSSEDQLYKGRICSLLGDYQSAQEYLTKAKDAKEPLASYYLGLNYEAQGESEQADACIKEFLESGEATSDDLYDLGMNELANADYESAQTYFQAGLALGEVSNRQNLMKGSIAAYEYSGDFDSAKEVLEEYLTLYPSDEEAQRESTFLETR